MTEESPPLGGRRSRVRVLPPFLPLSALATSVVLHRLLPLPAWPDSWALGLRWLGIASIVVSLALMVWVLGSFRRARTPFDVRKDAAALVTHGPFGISRNPGYVLMIAAYLGLGLAFASSWVLLLGPPWVVALRQLIILAEERQLEILFGDEYRSYKERCRRWL